MAKSIPVTASIIRDPRLIKPGAKALRHVTNRSGIANVKSGSSTTSGWRSWQVAYVPVAAIKLGIWNGYVGSATSGVETGCGGAMDCYLSVEYPRGTFTRLTWSGADHATIADNAVAYTDLVSLPVTIPAFAWFRIAGYFSMQGSGKVPSCNWSNICDRGNGDEYQVGTGADHTMDSTVLGSGLAGAVFPQVVLALSDRPVWGIIGDSIAAGVNDLMFDASGGRGQCGRALARLGPHLNYGVPGDQATLYTASHANRVALMQAGGMSSAILQLGVNDINVSRTSAQLIADRASIRGYFAGVNFYDATVTPQSNSTDGFLTAANQTVSSSTKNTQRTTFNDSLRNGMAATTSGVVDIAQAIETDAAHEAAPTLNGGVWLPGQVSSDGTHPTSKGYQVTNRETEALLATRR